MSFDPIRLVVFGRPAPQGSKVPFVRRGKGGQILGAGLKEDSGETGWSRWRPRVHDAAKAVARCACPDPDCLAFAPGYPIQDDLVASMVFYFARPLGHFMPPTRTRARGTVLRPAAPPVPTSGSTGDVEKLARAVADGLQSGGLIANDGLIVRYTRLERRYCGPHTEIQQAGAVIWVMPLVLHADELDPRYPGVSANLPSAEPSLDEIGV